MVLAQGLKKSHEATNCHLNLKSHEGSVRAGGCFQFAHTDVGWPQFLAGC